MSSAFAPFVLFVSFVVKQFCISSLEREEPRKSNVLPLDIAPLMVVLWFNGISGTRGQFRDIKKECIAKPCFGGLGGSDGEMCVGAFLRQKTRGREQDLPLSTELKV
jgi:RsiW-degrading membrane proteinase PrsW (M82 family)